MCVCVCVIAWGLRLIVWRIECNCDNITIRNIKATETELSLMAETLSSVDAAAMAYAKQRGQGQLTHWIAANVNQYVACLLLPKLIQFTTFA